MRFRIWIATTAVLVACGHGTPFSPGDYRPSQPFNNPPLVRITLNPARDYMPAWLPGDSSFAFTAERQDRGDLDHCLAFFRSVGGGAIDHYACRTSAANDSLDVFDEAAFTASGPGGGQVAYMRLGASLIPLVPLIPDVQSLVVAPLGDPNAARLVRDFPYFAPSGRTHWNAAHIHWLDATRLVYVAEDVSYPRGCPTCPPDTVHTGLEIALLDLAPATPVVTIVPGTDNASSVAVGANSDTLFFTRENESGIYRLALSSGQVDTVFDFGSGARVARDVAWAAKRLYVITDGDLRAGGDIHVIDPVTGNDSTVVPPGPPMQFKRPAPSADGRRILAQSAFDIWLLEQP